MACAEPQKPQRSKSRSRSIFQTIPQYLDKLIFRNTEMTREYTLIPDIFIQCSGEEQTNFETIPPRFGLIDDSRDRWSKLFKRIKTMNDADPNASYKVIFFGRHGEGFHNTALDKYGLDAWNSKWSMLEGDGETVWGPDAELTPEGRKQAQQVHEVWVKERTCNLPLPDKLFCSPMTRALQTNEITFHDILPRHKKVVVLENLREEHGLRLSDKRRSRTYIQEQFPNVTLEKDMTEEDTEWDPKQREGKEKAGLRFKAALDQIFEHRRNFISITGHVGILSGFLTSIGKKPYYLNPGGIYAMVIKGTIVTKPSSS